MQDFTGVPAVVDLASMRDAVKKSNGNPSLINPQCQTDLVIDHSVMVDHHGSEKSMELNTKLEYSRNSLRGIGCLNGDKRHLKTLESCHPVMASYIK